MAIVDDILFRPHRGHIDGGYYYYYYYSLCLFVNLILAPAPPFPTPSPITSSSSDSPLCTSITPSLFHSLLKSYLFHKFYPPVPLVSLLPPGLPPRTFACTVSSELLGFDFHFSLICSFLGRALE